MLFLVSEEGDDEVLPGFGSARGRLESRAISLLGSQSPFLFWVTLTCSYDATTVVADDDDDADDEAAAAALSLSFVCGAVLVDLIPVVLCPRLRPRRLRHERLLILFEAANDFFLLPLPPPLSLPRLRPLLLLGRNDAGVVSLACNPLRLRIVIVI